jgi:hypothetical protein
MLGFLRLSNKQGLDSQSLFLSSGCPGNFGEILACPWRSMAGSSFSGCQEKAPPIEGRFSSACVIG